MLTMGKRALVALAATCLLLAGIGCGGEKEPEVEELLVGTWRYSVKNIHTTMTFRANGSWVSGVRVEGELSKIVEKRGEASGQWIRDEDNLSIVVDKSEIEDMWQGGVTHQFKMHAVVDGVLPLESAEGKIREWQRLRARSQASGEEAGSENIQLGPIVVNLGRAKPTAKNRYLCIDLEFVFDPLLAEADSEGPPAIHPRIRELIMIFFTSRVYKDVNSLKKMQRIKGELFLVLSPYLPKGIKDIVIHRVVVTARRQGVEEFMSEYAVPAPPPAETAEGGDA